MTDKFTIQDYSTINTMTQKISTDFDLNDLPSAFYYFAFDQLLHLQDDEIDDCITDSNYLKLRGRGSGHDLGIDAVFIDEDTMTINLFNFKYATTYTKAKSHFPSKDISDICEFISNLLLQNEQALICNSSLKLKIIEIWNIFKENNPSFKIYLCSNYSTGLTLEQREKFIARINNFDNIEIIELTGCDFIELVSISKREPIDGKLKAINTNYFIKNDGKARALIANIDSRDLLRIVCTSKEDRNKSDIEYTVDTTFTINEDAFENNVRIYLKQRTNVNKNIKSTVLSDEKEKFFYYNNGITLTCKKFNCPTNQRSPVIELEDLQIVNGSQTIHSLYDAFNEDPTCLDNVDLLIRIYEIAEDIVFSTNIAEYTNSQNQVSSRDIRAIDNRQIKLEREFQALGYFYERKKNQFQSQPNDKRIDFEKVGQILMAYNNSLPGEAKNKKGTIFSSKYDEVFTDNITARYILNIYSIYNMIEKKRLNWKSSYVEEAGSDYLEVFVSYASYYILAIVGSLINNDKIDLQEIANTEKKNEKISSYILRANQMIYTELKALDKANGDKEIDIAAQFKYNNLLNRINVKNFLTIN